jgi:hypothetical protein
MLRSNDWAFIDLSLDLMFPDYLRKSATTLRETTSTAGPYARWANVANRQTIPQGNVRHNVIRRRAMSPPAVQTL